MPLKIEAGKGWQPSVTRGDLETSSSFKKKTKLCVRRVARRFLSAPWTPYSQSKLFKISRILRRNFSASPHPLPCLPLLIISKILAVLGIFKTKSLSMRFNLSTGSWNIFQLKSSHALHNSPEKLPLSQNSQCRRR